MTPTAAASSATDVRLTPQRRAVLDVLRSATDHPTAQDVYHRVRVSQPGIGPATVYRALALLVSSGQALELQLGDGSAARYDANVDRHDHLVCDSCGRAVDVVAPLPPTIPDEVAAASGFLLTNYDLRFHGLCPACQAADAQPSSA